MRQAIKGLKFFPKPVELREMVEGNPVDNADAAWAEVMREIARVGYMGVPEFSDERILRAVAEVWGSWRRLCETLPGEGPELLGSIKQFKATYSTLPRRDERKAITSASLPGTLQAFIKAEGKRIAAAKATP
jgi:hypothetical protein